MKKALLGTTAVAAAGLVAGPAFAQDGQITLSVGGYYSNWVSFVSQDEDGPENNIDVSPGSTVQANAREFNPVRFRHEGEIHFTGSTTLDNGLQVGFQAQLEAITQGDQMDETYLWFQGSWGRLLMGAENSAAYLMQYTAPNVGIPGVNSPSQLFSGCCRTATLGIGSVTGALLSAAGMASGGSVSAFNLAPTATLIGTSGDAEKVTYFTPRFGGFQFGVSYSPDLSNTTGIRRGSGLDMTGVAGNFNHTLAAGANFVDTIGSVDLAIAAGIEWANLDDSSPAAPLGSIIVGTPSALVTVPIQDVVTEDRVSFSAGLNIGYAGFVFGSSFIYHDDASGIDGLDSWAVDVGASYSTGPWSVSATYFYGEANYDDFQLAPGLVAGLGEQDERHLADVSVAYALSPGVTVSASAQYFNEDTEIVVEEDIEGFGFTVGTSLSF